MVSFSCEICNDTIVKKKLDQHQQRCYGAYFTCIDCSVTFYNSDHKKHTSCISEAEKYEKALYKGPKKQQQQQKKEEPKPVKKEEPKKEEAKPVEEKKESKKESKKEAKKKSKSKKESKEFDLSKYLSTGQLENLYKIIKKVSDDKSKDKKDILKKLSVVLGEDGNIIVKLD